MCFAARQTQIYSLENVITHDPDRQLEGGAPLCMEHSPDASCCALSGAEVALPSFEYSIPSCLFAALSAATTAAALITNHPSQCSLQSRC